MSGIGNEIGEAFKGAIPKCVDKAMENMTDKPTRTLGDFIESLVYIACGGVIHLVEKKKLVHAYKLEQFKASLKAKVDSTPLEKLIEPNTQIIMSALVDAQYCVEEDVLQDMFANLIASSVNTDLAPNIHPSFSGTLKQMTTVDAQNLMLFRTCSENLPVAQYHLELEPSGKRTMHSLVFLSNPAIQDIQIQATSLYSLAAFGFVEFDFTGHIIPESEYDVFAKTKEYESLQSFVDAQTGFSDGCRVKNRLIKKGMVNITERGKQFLDVCCPEKTYVITSA